MIRFKDSYGWAYDYIDSGKLKPLEVFAVRNYKVGVYISPSKRGLLFVDIKRRMFFGVVSPLKKSKAYWIAIMHNKPPHHNRHEHYTRDCSLENARLFAVGKLKHGK